MYERRKNKTKQQQEKHCELDSSRDISVLLKKPAKQDVKAKQARKEKKLFSKTLKKELKKERNNFVAL